MNPFILDANLNDNLSDNGIHCQGGENSSCTKFRQNETRATVSQSTPKKTPVDSGKDLTVRKLELHDIERQGDDSICQTMTD
jgi:hypothetical protein